MSPLVLKFLWLYGKGTPDSEPAFLEQKGWLIHMSRGFFNVSAQSALPSVVRRHCRSVAP